MQTPSRSFLGIPRQYCRPRLLLRPDPPAYRPPQCQRPFDIRHTSTRPRPQRPAKEQQTAEGRPSSCSFSCRPECWRIRRERRRALRHRPKPLPVSRQKTTRLRPLPKDRRLRFFPSRRSWTPERADRWDFPRWRCVADVQQGEHRADVWRDRAYTSAPEVRAAPACRSCPRNPGARLASPARSTPETPPSPPADADRPACRPTPRTDKAQAPRCRLQDLRASGQSHIQAACNRPSQAHDRQSPCQTGRVRCQDP